MEEKGTMNIASGYTFKTLIKLVIILNKIEVNTIPLKQWRYRQKDEETIRIFRI